MSKGKFSKPKYSHEMEETAELPQIPADQIGPEEDRPIDLDFNLSEDTASMPELDFHNLTEETLTDLGILDVQELTALELDRPAPELVPSEEKVPTEEAAESIAEDESAFSSESSDSEEEQIRRAFQQAAPQKPDSGFKVWLSRKKKAVLIGFSSLLAAALLTIVLVLVLPLLMDPYDRVILDGVSVAGIELGGLSRKEAVEAVEAKVPELFAQDMVITLPEQTLTLSSADTGVSLDVKGAVKSAYRYGRTGSMEQRERAFKALLSNPYSVDLTPYIKVNENYIQGQFKTYALEHKTVFAPSSYALEGEQPPLDLEHFNENNTCQTLLLNLGTPETVLDPVKASNQVAGAYADLTFAVSITPEQVGQLPEPLDLKKIREEIAIAPVDSALDMETFEIISGSYGYTFDKLKASRELTKAAYGDTVRISMQYQRPDKLNEDLLFQDVLGETETPHGNNEKRNVNLDLACKTLDGMILYPGDEFSFNEALGERTADKGYQAAPAYSGTRLVNSLGGGICQVSSTLYYASLLADMEITDRINHGFLSSYIAPGMDATVSWGKPDYKFKNSSKFPIKIHAETTEDKVIIQILGTDDRDYYVKMEYTDSVTSHEVVYQTVSSGSGYSNGDVIQGGSDGHFVTTYRCKYSKETDELLSRELETRSNYPAQRAILARVEAPPAPPAPETTPPAPEPPAETPAPEAGEESAE